MICYACSIRSFVLLLAFHLYRMFKSSFFWVKICIFFADLHILKYDRNQVLMSEFLFFQIVHCIIQLLIQFNSVIFSVVIFNVHIFWEGHKILRNLPLTFDCMYCSQKLVEDFAKFCGLLRIYELYLPLC